MENSILNKLLETNKIKKKVEKKNFLSYPALGIETKEFFRKINLLGGKKRLIFKTINIIGIIIVFLSFFYIDIKIEGGYENHENIILIIISVLTILYAILKFISKIFHEFILKFEKISLQSSSLIKKRFFFIFLIYLIHPNIFTKNIYLKIYWVAPYEVIQKNLNFTIIAFQNTIIFFEIFLRRLIHSQITEKQKYKIRKKKSNQRAFPFFFKYIFLKDPIFVVKWLLILSGLELGMLLKIMETDNYNNYITNWSDSFWTVFMIMANSGFGDVFPISYSGKFVTVLTGIIGYLIFSLVILGISNLLNFDDFDNKISFVIDKDELEMLRRDKAASVITIFLKCAKTFKENDIRKYFKYKVLLDKEMRLLRDINKSFKDIKNLKNFRKR